MTEQLRQTCDLFAENYDAIRRIAPWEYSMMHYLCAQIFTERGAAADKERIEECRRRIRQSKGIFSPFRNALSITFACLLSLEEAPQEAFGRVETAYEALRKEFRSSNYLPIAAFALAKGKAEEEFDRCAARAREMYDAMRKQHAVLTGDEDVPYAVVFAMGAQDVRVACEAVEAAYAALRQRFFHSDALQSASHCLAFEGDSVRNAERMIALWEDLKQRRCRYGTDMELVGLATLAVWPDAKADEIIEVSRYLQGKKGFGNWSLGQRLRLMYAASLATMDREKRNGLTAPEDRNRSLARRTMLLSVMGMMADRAAAAATANAAVID